MDQIRYLIAVYFTLIRSQFLPLIANVMVLKKTDTALIGWYQAYYNYTKKYIGLDGKTPAEASNIKVQGLNKW